MELFFIFDHGWRWIRTYLVAIVLLVAFASSMVEVYISGVCPMPQQPPQGYTFERTTATLQWNRGTSKKPMKLQVSVDDPSFSDLLLEKKVSGKTHSMRDLQQGRTYYWRVVGEDVSSPVAMFKTSPYAVNF